MLGVTYSAECSIPAAGQAEVKVYLLPSDGSLRWDTGTEVTENSTNEGRSASINQPAGTILTPTPFGAATANAGGSSSDHQSEIVQLAPVRGSLTIHEAASTQGSAQKCHVSVVAFAAG